MKALAVLCMTDLLHVILPVFLSLMVTLYIYYFNESRVIPKICRQNFLHSNPQNNVAQVECRPKCEHGQFSLPGMDSCRPWLTCDEIESEIKIGEEIGRGVVKQVNLAQWMNQKVAISRLTDEKYIADFQHGLKMLTAFQTNERFTQLIGFCDTSIVTEFHQFKSADNLENVLNLKRVAHYNKVSTRFQLCMDYVDILAFLHKSPIGTRVMCDSNDIDKTLSQFLLTSDLRLVVNDLDALPEAKPGSGVKCGGRQLFGDFVAPEQLWPYDDREFDDDSMPGYDEKIDVWRIPDVCARFLGSRNGSESLQFHLHRIHRTCKNIVARKRPSSLHIRDEYERVQRYLSLNKDKEL
ncbi:protein O-mannose kinase-like [Tubulanus polymorphus]|uniref:protein O-mannose kinase-like n=1 Tax=Tubulanus polymorphus TaxID=672921 RepID=UPI003DA1DF3A